MTRRYTIWGALGELFSAVFSVERGFIHTTKIALLDPGKMVKDYTSGVTRPYFPPFRFGFIWLTFYSLVVIYSGVLDQQMNTYSVQNPNASAEQQEMVKTIQDKIQTYFNFLGLLSLPFTALASKWISGRRREFFTEHLIANTYIMGSQSFALVVFLPLLFLLPDSGMWFTLLGILISSYLIGMTFHGWLGIPKFEAFARGVLANLLGMLLFILAAMIIGIAIAIVWAIATSH
ncbi:MAG: hypothetical protein RL226_2124 [Bacteroidota bacterium]|jgi:hypothetical protein